MARHFGNHHPGDHWIVQERLSFSCSGGHTCLSVLMVLKRISSGSVTCVFIAVAAFYLRLSYVSQAGDVCLGGCGSLFPIHLVVVQCNQVRVIFYVIRLRNYRGQSDTEF